MKTFDSANILFPRVHDLSKWSVIACDQFTSEPEYWDDVRNIVGDAPSTLNLILPEVELKNDYSEKVNTINATMEKYLEDGLFETYKNSYIYVERTLLDGSIRTGLIGTVDLEQYDYNAGSDSAIRASERTVISRIPPRKKVRENAPLELPHILLLCDDDQNMIFGTLKKLKRKLIKLYDFDLMKDGGHIKGYLLQGEFVAMINKKIAEYEEYVVHKHPDYNPTTLKYAMGDGNHSLATAKACYEDAKAKGEDTSKSRFAMVELGNIHEESLVFEPIHRVIFNTDVEALLKAVKENICADEGMPVDVYYGDTKETIYLDKSKGELDVSVLQAFLDEYYEDHDGEMDYIHGEDSVMKLAKQDHAIGFILSPMGKGQFFRSIISDGVLPRKTFSMGHAQEKRYYLEARKIK